MIELSYFTYIFFGVKPFSTKVKVICQGQGQISRSQFFKKWTGGVGVGGLVFHKHGLFKFGIDICHGMLMTPIDLVVNWFKDH